MADHTGDDCAPVLSPGGPLPGGADRWPVELGLGRSGCAASISRPLRQSGLEGTVGLLVRVAPGPVAPAGGADRPLAWHREMVRRHRGRSLDTRRRHGWTAGRNLGFDSRADRLRAWRLNIARGGEELAGLIHAENGKSVEDGHAEVLAVLGTSRS